MGPETEHAGEEGSQTLWNNFHEQIRPHKSDVRRCPHVTNSHAVNHMKYTNCKAKYFQ